MAVVPERIVEAELCVVKRQLRHIEESCFAWQGIGDASHAPCQSRTVPSPEAEARYLPSGDHATRHTRSV